MDVKNVSTIASKIEHIADLLHLRQRERGWRILMSSDEQITLIGSLQCSEQTPCYKILSSTPVHVQIAHFIARADRAMPETRRSASDDDALAIRLVALLK